MKDHEIRIASWPWTGGDNPYIDLFYRALEPHGITLVKGLHVDDGLLRSHARDLHFFHLHWPEAIWRGEERGIIGRARGLLGLVRFLRLARSLDIRVIWTVHNLHHHEGARIDDRLGYRILARYADLLICHTEWCRQQVLETYRIAADKTIVMPHGNYDGVYPPSRARADTLAALDLRTDRRTLLCFGLVRPYKGFDIAVAAMRSLGVRYQLIIAGQSPKPEWERDLRSAAPRETARLLFERVDAQSLSDLAQAADCVLLPYRDITGSAVLLTALTLGRGVVASDLPPFRETLSREGGAGVLYAPNTPDALATAIDSFFEVPLSDRSAAARRLSARYRWRDVTEPVATRLRQLRSR